MRNIIFFTLLPTIILSGSCNKKNDSSPPADTSAVITINSPIANAHYVNATILQIRGNVNDADILKSAKMEIKNKSTGAVLNTQTSLTGSIAVYSFNWSWTITGITTPITATVKITSTDQFNYVTNKEIDIILEN